MVYELQYRSVYRLSSTYSMSDEAAIRRVNLNRLCKARSWKPADLHSAMGEDGGTYSYWPNLLSNSKKSFGEKTARKIEDALSLPRGWLDRDDEVPPPNEKPQDEGKLTLVVAEALKTLGPEARREALEFFRFKLERQNSIGVAEKLAQYISDDGRDPADLRSPRKPS